MEMNGKNLLALRLALLCLAFSSTQAAPITTWSFIELDKFFNVNPQLSPEDDDNTLSNAVDANLPDSSYLSNALANVKRVKLINKMDNLKQKCHLDSYIFLNSVFRAINQPVYNKQMRGGRKVDKFIHNNLREHARACQDFVGNEIHQKITKLDDTAAELKDTIERVLYNKLQLGERYVSPEIKDQFKLALEANYVELIEEALEPIIKGSKMRIPESARAGMKIFIKHHVESRVVEPCKLLISSLKSTVAKIWMDGLLLGPAQYPYLFSKWAIYESCRFLSNIDTSDLPEEIYYFLVKSDADSSTESSDSEEEEEEEKKQH